MEAVRCPGCMREKTQHPLCEHCGYNEHIDNYSHQLPIGTVLRGRYEIGKVLGQGGFGITYIGWDYLKKMPVAIKEFYPKRLVGRENTRTNLVSTLEREGSEPFARGKAKFLKEAHTLARLTDYPEIVRIYNFFEENNTAYMVMEYLKGANLRQYVWMKGGRISLKKTLAVMRPIMRALQVVHEEHLVHRDISPDNIMLMPGGKIKLLDFGAAREVLNAAPDKQLTHSTEAILKHGFAPIEQYHSNGSLGPWTDIYALAATIYYCLTGTVPTEVHQRLLEGERLSWKDIPELSPEQIGVLNRAMAIMPGERIQSVKELEDALFSGEPPVIDEDDQRLDFSGEKNGRDGGRTDTVDVSTVNDWEFSSGGTIVEKQDDRKNPKEQEAERRSSEKNEKKAEIEKKLAKTWILKAVLGVMVLFVAVAMFRMGMAVKQPGDYIKPGRDGFFDTEKPDRTVAYEDGTQVEVYLNDKGQEKRRILRDAQKNTVYQFTAEYNKEGLLSEQKVYDGNGKLLRTDTYSDYTSDGILTSGQSRDAGGELLWEGKATFVANRLTGFRESYADGRSILWAYDENHNVTSALFYDEKGNQERAVKYTEFLAFSDTEREGTVDSYVASQMAARGGYGAAPMNSWDGGDRWGGGGGGAAEKKPGTIAIAITEPEETWEETTEVTEAAEELQIWHDHDSNKNTAMQIAPETITLNNVKKGDTYQLAAIGDGADNVIWGCSTEGIASVDADTGTVTFTGKSGSATVELFRRKPMTRYDCVVFIVTAKPSDSDGGNPERRDPGGQPIAETEAVAVTEPEETGTDRSDVTLWVNTRRTDCDANMFPHTNYETRYDDTGLATGETCMDFFSEQVYVSEFRYSGDELIGEDRTAADKKTEIGYVRDIYGNVVWTWTLTVREADGTEPPSIVEGQWTKIDLSACYNG